MACSTRRAASLPGEGSTHLRGCGMTAVGTPNGPIGLVCDVRSRGKAEVTGDIVKPTRMTQGRLFADLRSMDQP